MREVLRLFDARVIAVVGGGAWGAAIVEAARRIGFSGRIVPVHPSAHEIAGLQAVHALADVVGPIDVAFVGVNRVATIEIVRQLRELGAGGAVCFASGFGEAAAEDGAAVDLQAQLVDAAGDMPVLGPNCYGFVNALDQVAVWPDQHGLEPVERGVAILTQSSNIAINLTMQRRGVPIAYMVTCGNMAVLSQADLARALLADDRVSAIGVHIEGFGDLRAWEAFAQEAWARGVPVVALKVGASEQARQATVSHTASLAGSDAGARAFLARLGVPQVGSLEAFLETLKLFHVVGRLEHPRVASISCSGGEASLIADMALGHGVEFPSLTDAQKGDLRAALGPMVALANPLDYHTYVWRDAETMGRAWQAMADGDVALTLSIVDYPHTDQADWDCATQAALRVKGPMAVVSSLPELMPEDVAQRLIAGGVVPMHGLGAALEAIRASSSGETPIAAPVVLGAEPVHPEILSEAQAKSALATFGVPVPANAAQCDLTGPLVVKRMGLAHKSEAGAVRLGIAPSDLADVKAEMGGDDFLVEEMVEGAIAELLIGVLRDPAHGFVLTLGAGGVLTEILRDTQHLLLPMDASAVETALRRLKCWPVLDGYRGKPKVDLAALIRAVLAVQAYVLHHADEIEEVEINPLICTETGAVAADALIRKGTS